MRRHTKCARAEDQRLAVIVDDVFDTPDEDQVVAAFNDAVSGAFEPSDAVVENRTASEADGVGNALELVRRRRREMFAVIVLVRPEHVHGKKSGVLEAFQRRGPLLQAPQDQGWIEGNGRKRISRQPLQLPRELAL